MIFIDSDFIIDYLRGDENTIKIINNLKEDIATTEVNVFEIMYGLHIKQSINQDQIDSAKEFFNTLTIFPFNSNCGEKSAKILTKLIKEGKEIEQNDCFIASIILENRFNKILTNNKKHFERIEEIKLI
ncbi:MAG: type II toxin-antitoxin system VapC family toxin [Nanoarchaeota archaeon]